MRVKFVYTEKHLSVYPGAEVVCRFFGDAEVAEDSDAALDIRIMYVCGEVSPAPRTGFLEIPLPDDQPLARGEMGRFLAAMREAAKAAYLREIKTAALREQREKDEERRAEEKYFEERKERMEDEDSRRAEARLRADEMRP